MPFARLCLHLWRMSDSPYTVSRTELSALNLQFLHSRRKQDLWSFKPRHSIKSHPSAIRNEIPLCEKTHPGSFSQRSNVLDRRLFFFQIKEMKRFVLTRQPTSDWTERCGLFDFNIWPGFLQRSCFRFKRPGFYFIIFAPINSHHSKGDLVANVTRRIKP